jgi:DNA polymerase I-like protein with 3'-5' exonuclease and polymerase domains
MGKEEFKTITVDRKEKLQACLDALSACKRIAFDTETTSIVPTQADLVGISLAGDPQ